MKKQIIKLYIKTTCLVLILGLIIFFIYGFITCNQAKDTLFKNAEIKKEQLINQLKKLHNVKNVELLDEEQTVERELMLVKVKNSPENRSEVMAASEIYRAKVIDYNPDTLCVEVTGEPSKINAFINVMKPLGIIELCRTGVVALERGRSII